MRTNSMLGVALIAMLGFAVVASGYPEYARQTKAACAACHLDPAGGRDLTDAGKAFKTDKKKVPAAGATGADYVGFMRCRSCHPVEFTAWKKTPHASALEMLKAAPDSAIVKMATALKVTMKGPPDKNDACVICHVTGFHLAGGYPAADSLRTAAVSNVSCESCHGPGGRHVTAPLADKKKTIQRDVSAGLCTQCHGRATSPHFDFDEYKKRDPHMTPETKTEN